MNKRIGSGKILLARKDHPSVNEKISFINPIPIKNHRASRKLLELTSEECAIQMNAKEIWGLSSFESYSGVSEDLYEIDILGYHYCSLKHTGKALMLVQDGLPLLPRPCIDENELRMEIPRIFKYVQYDEELLVSLITEAAKEKHGTTLVIAENAEEEAERLCSQAILIEPIALKPELLKQITPIDGAVLINPLGTCYAIGVILDGLASDLGDLARGARYNSAVRYNQQQPKQCLAIVISEDGGIDYIFKKSNRVG